MRIKFLGAVEHITGSCSWLHYSKTGAELLVDCGLNQGAAVEQLNRQEFPFNPENIRCVLLTHAHIDHCGLIPRLYRKGFRGKVYTTTATAELAKISLRDAAKIQTEQPPVLFDREDVELINFVCVDQQQDFYWGKPITITDGVRVAFMRSSHILGAASISVSWLTNDQITDDKSQFKTMFFSGDIGNNTESNSYLPMLKPNNAPFPNTDYILTESTYGGSERAVDFKSARNRLHRLHEELSETIFENNAKVIIPTFSIQRAQELMLDLIAWLNSDYYNQYQERLSSKQPSLKKRIKVLCHSSMILKANAVFSRELFRTMKTKRGVVKPMYLSNQLESYLNLDPREDFYTLIKRLFQDTGDKNLQSDYIFKMGGHEITVTSQQLTDTQVEKYDIILASSGMCDHGPIAGYLDRYLDCPSNKIFITGFQATGSRGRELLANIERDGGMSAKVVDLSGFYSAHADQSILLDFLLDLDKYIRNKTPVTVLINHGEEKSKNSLMEKLEQRAKLHLASDRVVKDVRLADRSDNWFNLTTGDYEISEESASEQSKISRKELQEIKSLLNELLLTQQRLLYK